jgi:tetratricopeptide (TPR) repeat protein
VRQIKCDQVRFDQPPPAGALFGKADRFNYYLSAATILNTLWRPKEALEQLAAAEQIYDENRDLHYLKGAALLAIGSTAEGERELRRSLEIAPYDQASMVLSAMLRGQQRYNEALDVVNRALKSSVHPHELYMAQGTLSLDTGQLSQSLISFDKAEEASPFKGAAASLGPANDFNRWLADGRETAWARLAELYEAQGLRREAMEARTKSQYYANANAGK